MEKESGLDRDVLLREAIARHTVLETVQTQLMLQLAGAIFDQPQEFVRNVMMAAEQDIRRGREQATGDAKIVADDAVRVLDDYSMRLLATLTPATKPQ